MTETISTANTDLKFKPDAMNGQTLGRIEF